MMDIEVREVWRESFRIWSVDWLVLTGVALFAGLPVLLMQTQYIQMSGGMDGLTSAVALSIFSVLPYWVQGFITYRILCIMRGFDVDLSESFKVGKTRIKDILIVSVLGGLGYLGGSLCCAIPSIAVTLLASLAMPVLLIEHQSPWNALLRSTDLIWRRLQDSVFVWLGYGVVYVAVIWLVYLIGQETGVFGVDFEAALLGETADAVEVGTGFLIFWYAAHAILCPLSSVVSAVLYHDIRFVTEGVDLDQMLETIN